MRGFLLSLTMIDTMRREKIKMEAQNTLKQRIFSGIQPTGNLTLGNYIVALRNFGVL